MLIVYKIMHILTDTDRCTLSLETLISTEWKLRNPIVCIAYDINDLRIKFICMNGKYLEISVLSPGCTGASTPPTCSLTPELLNIEKQFQYNAIYIHILKKINTIMKEKYSTLRMNERMNEWLNDIYLCSWTAARCCRLYCALATCETVPRHPTKRLG